MHRVTRDAVEVGDVQVADAQIRVGLGPPFRTAVELWGGAVSFAMPAESLDDPATGDVQHADDPIADSDQTSVDATAGSRAFAGIENSVSIFNTA